MSKATCLLNCNIGDTIFYVRSGYNCVGQVLRKKHYDVITTISGYVSYPSGNYPVVIGGVGYEITIHPYSYLVTKIIKKK